MNYEHLVRISRNFKPAEQQGNYDIDEFLKKQYATILPVSTTPFPFTAYVQVPKKAIMPDLPDESRIYHFCKRVVEKCKLNAECVIISLIYIERLMEITSIKLSLRNWIPILLVSLLISSKVWDDISTFNGDLCAVLPFFNIHDVNELERRFLSDLKFDLHISFSDYGKYYFGLRAIKKSKNREIPKYYLKIGIGKAGETLGQARRENEEKLGKQQIHDRYVSAVSL